MNETRLTRALQGAATGHSLDRAFRQLASLVVNSQVAAGSGGQGSITFAKHAADSSNAQRHVAFAACNGLLNLVAKCRSAASGNTCSAHCSSCSASTCGSMEAV